MWEYKQLMGITDEALNEYLGGDWELHHMQFVTTVHPEYSVPWIALCVLLRRFVTEAKPELEEVEPGPETEAPAEPVLHVGDKVERIFWNSAGGREWCCVFIVSHIGDTYVTLQDTGKGWNFVGNKPQGVEGRRVRWNRADICFDPWGKGDVEWVALGGFVPARPA